ncbi:hypothetical protein FRB93_005718 [Tulasnella sp. JGI-2019a]|nr:hypothetical protein FRB93_005718 [Tulasnella sp. JGI-2019a]
MTSTDCPLCLTISEIRLQIFEELDFESLLSAALVCKDWTWQATYLLWRNRPISLSCVLAPLMNCTADFLHNCASPDDLPPIKDGHVVDSEGWQTRLDCREKVTGLVIDLAWKVARAAKLDQRMESRATIMFPNAISLHLSLDGRELSDENDDEDRWTPLLPVLLGPNLRELSLEAYEITERVFQDNINALARIAPEIHTVVIKNWPDTFSPSDFPFTQMKHLMINSFINRKSWRALANYSRLETIYLQGFVANSRDLTPNPQNFPVTLPCLKALSIGSCFGPQLAIELFRNTIMPALQS